MSDPKALVREFLTRVRSGAHADEATDFMAPLVLAHQVVSEETVTIERTPAQYAGHVREMKAAYGDFGFEITELLADGDKVYARWRQTGNHLADDDGHRPTGAPLVEIASAVYRVADGRIVEYWIQIDREGLRVQLDRARAPRPALPASPGWRRTGHDSFITAALVDGLWWVLRLNCFPDHPLWTLFAGGRRWGDLEETPAGWTIPRVTDVPMESVDAADALAPVAGWVAYGSEVGMGCDNIYCCG
ncbi:hypothetical protein Afil01_14590 [Actinorhabdospora filicis]|uniref:Polyketide cyclase n=1 Tax=Actinorhabdospora filicis TaxID=1785913 RepID=A0A9W6SIX1_9ACTN|nr:ester cyclase [Actinorhabdospora filicis]GLZ76652.1 hypothetical protein Afil01_14590 [Actinorhabdospora filicis]